MKDRAVLIITACFIRLASNLLWPFWGGATLYYIGQATFEALILWVLLSFSQGHLKTILSFFFGLACFAFVKEIVFNPCELDLPEYIGIVTGFVFLLFTLYRSCKKSKS